MLCQEIGFNDQTFTRYWFLKYLGIDLLCVDSK